MGKYIADFVCLERELVVELDGGQHQAQADYDSERTKMLEASGYRVVRFWNSQVFEEMESVQESILLALNEGTPSP